MDTTFNHHLACLERHLQNLDQDLAGMSAKANKLYLALYHAVELGSATNTVTDLTPDAVLRLRHEVAERLSHMLANHGLT